MDGCNDRPRRVNRGHTNKVTRVAGAGVNPGADRLVEGKGNNVAVVNFGGKQTDWPRSAVRDYVDVIRRAGTVFQRDNLAEVEDQVGHARRFGQAGGLSQIHLILVTSLARRGGAVGTSESA